MQSRPAPLPCWFPLSVDAVDRCGGNSFSVTATGEGNDIEYEVILAVFKAESEDFEQYVLVLVVGVQYIILTKCFQSVGLHIIVLQ